MSTPIELLMSNVSQIRISNPTDRIHKQECCISCDTPRSEGGLFIDMNTFLAFGKDYVSLNYEKTGNSVYFHIKQTRKSVPEDRIVKKPTLLVTGIDAGFDNHEHDYEETYNIVILPDFVSLPFPSGDLPEQVRSAGNAILMANGTKQKVQLASWIADKKKVSAYSLDLKQIDNAVIVPPCGWKCWKCDKTDNLWLNLTDGMILCGSGGNNHAVEHYNETHYPLAVKLGSFADLKNADVFSYPENERVEDLLLDDHLAFFGIYVSSMQKTEMTTAEMELDQNTNFDWNRIQESGQEFEPLSGPGYTGLINLGNRAKLGHGLLSGKYPVPALEKDEIANSTTPTSSVDALEFFLHLIDKVERDNSGNFELDPTRSFKFGIEERLQCPSGKVSYSRRVDHILSLDIPLYEAINKEQLAAFYKLKADKSLEGKEVSGDEIVRPRVPLEACLANFSAPVEVDGFYSTALNAKTTAIITTGLTSFPDYLVLHMRRFVAEEGKGWVPKKLDVCIDVPDVIDISHMRSRGLQPGEELLPEAAAAAGREKVQSRVDKATNWVFSQMEDIAASYDIDTDEGWNDDQTSFVDQSNLDTLISFGFQEELAWSALVESRGNVEAAVEWIFNNPPGISDPWDMVTTAITVNGSPDKPLPVAIPISVNHAPEKPLSDATPINLNHAPDIPLPDGGGKYKLMGLVSHIGKSAQCGQYVAHMYKDGRWLIFNDGKVGISTNPPKDMGYLYFFERYIG